MEKIVDKRSTTLGLEITPKECKRIDKHLKVTLGQGTTPKKWEKQEKYRGIKEIKVFTMV